MRIRTRVINGKWLELTISTKKCITNIVYWGGLKFSCNKFYANKWQ